MEKTIEISGKKVTFKKTGATMLQYKRQTGREFYKDLSAFLNCVGFDENGEIKDISKKTAVNVMSETDFEYMYSMLHIMARAADKNIPADMLDWLYEFDDFPVLQIFCELLPMINGEMAVDRKNA